MRVAAIQNESGPDQAVNLERVADLLVEAASADCALIALPELFGFLGRGTDLRAGAEPLEGPTLAWARQQATRAGAWLLAGSFVEVVRSDGDSEDRFFNTSCLVSPTGDLRATYRKIHLFDVEVDGAGLHESDVFSAGSEVVVAPLDGVDGPDGCDPPVLGLTTCYDLRFPELFRIQALRGASVTVLPSAFTAATGPPHWEVLVRARAIENQVFVIAPDQCGTSADGIARHGHSLVVDPWGRVLADGGTHEGIIMVDLDLSAVATARAQVPSLANRRQATYRWPT